MKSWVKRRFSGFLRHSWVLMYHRIAEPLVDPWNLAVKTEIFEEQLAWLRKHRNILPLEAMVAAFKSGELRKRSIGVTFDDGYLDNMLVALPLLERYEMPATFFICSEPVKEHRFYWWDELAQIILSSELRGKHTFTLDHFSLTLDYGQPEEMSQHVVRNWRFPQPPPNEIAAAFMKFWEELRMMSHLERNGVIQRWKLQVDGAKKDITGTIDTEQLQKLASHPLITIGAHTERHPALQYQDTSTQKDEMLTNKQWLEAICGKPVKLLAYPYGSYNDQSLLLAKECGFEAAFATHSSPLRKTTGFYNIGRLMVTNETKFQHEL